MKYYTMYNVTALWTTRNHNETIIKYKMEFRRQIYRWFNSIYTRLKKN